MNKKMCVINQAGFTLWVAAIALLLTCTSAHAVIKLDTASMAANTSNWSVAPGTTDIGEFDGTCSSLSMAALTLGGANLTLGGLQFNNTMTGPATILSGNTLTLGTSGINMNSANQDVTINCGIGIGGNQTWDVAAGRALAFATGVSASGASARIVTKSGAGSLGLNGMINFQSNGGGEGFLVTGGSVSATGVIIGRNAYAASVNTIGVPSSAAATTSGFYVNGSATVVNFTGASTTSYIGYQNSGATARIDDGAVTMAGPLVLGRTSNTRVSIIQVNGGSFSTTNSLLIAPNYSSITNTAVLYLTGGIASFEKIGFGSVSDTLGGNGYVTLAGGTLYLGSGGIVRNTTVGAYNAKICLNSGTLGAKSDWNTSLNATLNGTVTIQAADAGGVARNITLSGNISTTSGTGAIIKTGDGTLALAGNNSYAGSTRINAGTLQVGTGGTSGNLSAADAIAITNNGTLAFKRSDSVTFSGVISGSGSVKQLGSGTLTLTGNNTYSGGTVVSAGTLLVNDANGISTGAVTVLDSGLLGGTGTVSVAVTINAGGGLAPGNSVGSLTVGSLTMNSGTTNSFEFSSTPANDQAVVSTAGGLVLNDGAFGLYAEGGTTPWTTPGTYNLIQYTGSLSGTGTDGSGNLNSDWTSVSAFNPHVANPQPGFSYAFAVSGGWLTLTITSDASVNKGTWTGSSDGNWSEAGNWTAENGTMPPRNARDTAILGDTAALRTVTLDANESVGALTFNNANSFVIANGGSMLTLDKAGLGAEVTVAAGTANQIQSSVSLNDNADVSITNGAALSITGVIGNTGGSKTLSVSGNGTLALSGANSYGPAAGSLGTTLSGGGVVQMGHASALGAGDVSVVDTFTLQAGAVNLDVTNNVGIAADGVLTVDNASYAMTLRGLLSGLGSLRKIGSGTLSLISANAYMGGTVIGAGAVSLSTTSAGNTGLGLGAVTITNNARLALYSSDGNDPGFEGACTFQNNMVVPAGAAATVWHSARGTISGSLTGSGTLNLRMNYVRGDISGNWSAFEGQINVLTRDGNDDCRFANGNPGLPKAALHLHNGANFYMYNHFGGPVTFVIGTLSGATNSLVASGSNVGGRIGTYQVGARNEDSLFEGRIVDSTGATALTKVGTGILTLTGVNTYTGPTAVNNGMLVIDGSLATNVTVAAGAKLGGSGTINGAVSLSSGVSSIILSNGVVNTLTVGAGLTLTGGNVLCFDVGSTADQIAVTGGASAQSGTISVVVNPLESIKRGHKYDLISGIGLADASGFMLTGLPPELHGTLAAEDGNLQLVIPPAATLILIR